MKLIAPEKSPFTYVFPSELGKISRLSEFSSIAARPEFSYEFANGADTRIIFTEFLPGFMSVSVLWWQSPPVDLSLIDARISIGDIREEDFSNSFRTQYQNTFCDNCGTITPTLVIRGGDAYLGNPQLLQQKISKAKPVSCPACSSRYRQLTVKVLSKLP